MHGHIQRGKCKMPPVVLKVTSVANLTRDDAITGELGAESVLQVQRLSFGGASEPAHDQIERRYCCCD